MGRRPLVQRWQRGYGPSACGPPAAATDAATDAADMSSPAPANRSMQDERVHAIVDSRTGVDVLGEGDTIAAIVTGVGGSVGIVRISGPAAVPILMRVFRRSMKRSDAGAGTPAVEFAREFASEASVKTHRVYHGYIVDPDECRPGEEGRRRGEGAGGHPGGGTSVDASSSAPPLMVDEVLAIVMRGPRSYTCEDVVEIHTHGGPLHPKRVLDIVMRGGATRSARAADDPAHVLFHEPAPRARMARPGEFTYRAFMNGRIDLTQAEAVAAAVSARTARQADMAMAGVAGSVSKVTKSLRSRCMDLVVELEARLDFDDEVSDGKPATGDGSGGGTAAETLRIVRQISEEIDAALAASRRNSVINDEFVVAILGRPNAGKSSLINSIIGSEKFIVTSAPGTTRDVNEATFVLNGEVRVKLLDTAGIRTIGGANGMTLSPSVSPAAPRFSSGSEPAATAEEIELLGIHRSISAAKVADAIMYVVDINDGLTEDDVAICAENIGVDEADARVLFVFNKVDTFNGDIREIEVPGQVRHILSEDKIPIRIDLQSHGEDEHVRDASPRYRTDIRKSVLVSAKRGTGMDELQDKLAALLTDNESDEGNDAAIDRTHSLWTVNQRQEEGLLRARCVHS